MRLLKVAILYFFVHFSEVSLHPQSSTSNLDQNESWEALHEAIKIGAERIVARLIRNGANVNAVNPNTNVPALILAIAEGHDKIAELLIQKGADVNVMADGGNTALAIAAAQGFVKIVQMLIGKGANVNAVNNKNATALLIAASIHNFKRKEYLSIIELLIDNGANINAVNSDNYSALMLAMDPDTTKVADLLIQRDADVNIVGKDGFTALILIAKTDYVDIMRKLIEKGADVNAVNEENNTVLILVVKAAKRGFGQVFENAYLDIIKYVELLLKNGANVNARNSWGDSALFLAAAKVEGGLGQDDLVKALINNGAEVNVHPKYTNNTPLIQSIISDKHDFSIGLELIDRGANVNAVGDDGFTPLQMAAKMGHKEIAEALIRKGANINATSDMGDSALNLAVMKEAYRTDLIKLLIENGADINHKGNFGRTPLIGVAKTVKLYCLNTWNCPSEYKEILQLLIDKGANVNAVDQDVHSALDVVLEARESTDRTEMIRILREHGTKRGAGFVYRKAAVEACRLYSNLTARWNHLTGGRVSDGSLVEAGEFPWVVALGYLSSQYKVRFSCGGSLISETFVLTAAHCVKDNQRPVVARLGKVTLTDEDDNFRAENQNIREIILHPEYSALTRKNDIALIQLIDRQWIKEFIHPVCIQTQLLDEHSRTNLIVSGWGRVNKTSTSTDLLKIDLKTMPLAECNETMWNYNKGRDLSPLRNGIDESQYCAHDPEGRKDSCQGDSGGPLQTTQTFSNPVKLVGVVSFGIGCNSGLPGIYTRVAHYVEWIGSYVWPQGEIPTPRIYIPDNNDDDVYYFSSK